MIAATNDVYDAESADLDTIEAWTPPARTERELDEAEADIYPVRVTERCYAADLLRRAR